MWGEKEKRTRGFWIFRVFKEDDYEVGDTVGGIMAQKNSWTTVTRK